MLAARILDRLIYNEDHRAALVTLQNLLIDGLIKSKLVKIREHNNKVQVGKYIVYGEKPKKIGLPKVKEKFPREEGDKSNIPRLPEPANEMPTIHYSILNLEIRSLTEKFSIFPIDLLVSKNY